VLRSTLQVARVSWFPDTLFVAEMTTPERGDHDAGRDHLDAHRDAGDQCTTDD
jgi:hypothetical protein